VVTNQVKTACASVLVLMWAGSANARCNVPHTKWVEDGVTQEIMHVDKDGICTLRLHAPDGINRVEFQSRPRNGLVGRAHLYLLAYKANPNFEGKDRFSFSVKYKDRYGKDSTTEVDVSVTVGNQH
jgi:hypothetical protein